MLGGKTVIQAEAMIRGDLARIAPPTSSSGGSTPSSNTAVAIGRYCFLSKGCCLRPPGRMWKGYARPSQHLAETSLFSKMVVVVVALSNSSVCRHFTYMPLRVGDHVFVGQNAVVQAASIGNHVHIGQDAVVGEFAIIKDYVRIFEGSVVPANMVIPSFSIVAGQPARVIGEVPEGGHEAFELRELYKTVGNNPQPA